MQAEVSGRVDVEDRRDTVDAQRHEQEVRVQGAQDSAADVQGAVEDPTATASDAATTAATDEAIERSPVDPAEAKANVNVATDTIQHPADAAKGHAEVSHAEVRGGIDPTKKG